MSDVFYWVLCLRIHSMFSYLHPVFNFFLVTRSSSTFILVLLLRCSFLHNITWNILQTSYYPVISFISWCLVISELLVIARDNHFLVIRRSIRPSSWYVVLNSHFVVHRDIRPSSWYLVVSDFLSWYTVVARDKRPLSRWLAVHRGDS